MLVYDGYMAVPMLDASVPVPVDLAADDGDLPVGGGNIKLTLPFRIFESSYTVSIYWTHFVALGRLFSSSPIAIVLTTSFDFLSFADFAAQS